MDVLVLEMSPELLERLRAVAASRQEPPEKTAVSLLEECLTSPPASKESERERMRRILREAGLLRDLGQTLREHAKQLDRQLGSAEEMGSRRRALQNRRLDPPLSQDILDMRGPKS